MEVLRPPDVNLTPTGRFWQSLSGLEFRRILNWGSFLIVFRTSRVKRTLMKLIWCTNLNKFWILKLPPWLTRRHYQVLDLYTPPSEIFTTITRSQSTSMMTWLSSINSLLYISRKVRGTFSKETIMMELWSISSLLRECPTWLTPIILSCLKQVWMRT